MNFFRAVGRGLVVVAIIAAGCIELMVRRPKTRMERAEWLNRVCRRAIRLLGVEVRVEGRFPESGALISNHLSYADIVVLASLHPCVFVSKVEIASWPVVGWMTTMAGTVYVARGHGGSAMKARAGMQAALDAKVPVVFFPEGTTSNGSGLLKFHSGLLGQVMEGGAAVRVAFLRYSLTADNGPGVSVSEDVCWGDRGMGEHVFKFLGLRGVCATVRFAEEPIAFSRVGLHRKEAAVEARAAMAALGGVAIEMDVPANTR